MSADSPATRRLVSGRRTRTVRSPRSKTPRSPRRPPHPPTGYQHLSYRSVVDDSEQPFALWVPRTYSARRSYPLIVALHGTDANERMIPEDCFGIHHHGFSEHVLFLAPFGRGDLWYRWMGERDFWDTILWVKKRYRVDARRQYLTGLSMGGYACWRLGSVYADQWAAVAPICGGGNREILNRLAHTPMWCVHGENDPYVPVEESRRLVRELQDRQAPCRYDELAGWGHNAWEWLYNPFRQDSLTDWFLQHRRPTAPRPVKRPRRRGRFEDVFFDRLIISYPAHSAIPRESDLLRAEAERIARFHFGDLVMRAGQLIIRPDNTLTPADLKGANHLMLGRTDNHSALRKASRRLWARHVNGRLVVRRQPYLGKSLVAATCQPSPWNARRLLAIITYQQVHSMRDITATWFHPDSELRAVNLYETHQARFIRQED